MDLNTAQEMYQYCRDNNLGSGFNEKWGLKHFGLIQNNLIDGEKVLLPFIGFYNYSSMTKHSGYFAYAITNKRILMAQKKLFGETGQTVSLDNINDITYKSGFVWGVLTIDTIKEVFNVGLDKKSADKIHKAVISQFQKYKDSNKSGTDVTAYARSSAKKIKEFKELLDMGAITQEEYEKKKIELLQKNN